MQSLGYKLNSLHLIGYLLLAAHFLSSSEVLIAQLAMPQMSDYGILIAANRKKNSRQKAAAKHRVKLKEADESRSKNQSIRLYGGPYVGIKNFDGLVLTYGLDYGLKTNGLQFLLGTSFWRHTHREVWTDATIETILTMYYVDGGVAYPWSIAKNLTFEVGLRAGYGNIRLNSRLITESEGPGLSDGKSFWLASPFLGLRYEHHRFQYGFEVRKPTFFDSELKDYSGYNLFLHIAYLI